MISIKIIRRAETNRDREGPRRLERLGRNSSVRADRAHTAVLKVINPKSLINHLPQCNYSFNKLLTCSVIKLLTFVTLTPRNNRTTSQDYNGQTSEFSYIYCPTF